jgi:hypothetical protein
MTIVAPSKTQMDDAMQRDDESKPVKTGHIVAVTEAGHVASAVETTTETSVGERVRRMLANEKLRGFRSTYESLLRCAEFQRLEDVGGKMTRAADDVVAQRSSSDHHSPFVASVFVSRHNINAAHIWATADGFYSVAYSSFYDKLVQKRRYIYLDVSTGSACASLTEKAGHQFGFAVDKATRSKLFVPAALVVFSTTTRLTFNPDTNDRLEIQCTDDDGKLHITHIKFEMIELTSG